MPVSRIEKIEASVVVARAETAKSGPNKGKYLCLEYGKNIDPVAFSSLDDAASFLRAHPQSGIRMNPGWSKIVEDIHIDGVRR